MFVLCSGKPAIQGFSPISGRTRAREAASKPPGADAGRGEKGGEKPNSHRNPHSRVTSTSRYAILHASCAARATKQGAPPMTGIQAPAPTRPRCATSSKSTQTRARKRRTLCTLQILVPQGRFLSGRQSRTKPNSAKSRGNRECAAQNPNRPRRKTASPPPKSADLNPQSPTSASRSLRSSAAHGIGTTAPQRILTIRTIQPPHLGIHTSVSVLWVLATGRWRGAREIHAWRRVKYRSSTR